MTALWFSLAILALAGAGVLLYLDRSVRRRTGRIRQMWAKAQSYRYESANPALPATWHRATLAKQGYLSALDIVSGSRRGDKFLLFDLEDTATIVAVQRQIGSDVDVDLRLNTASPPKDPDLELLGGIGDRVVFASDIDIAKRVCDQRMIAFLELVPQCIQVLWSENDWTLGSLPISTPSNEWNQAIDAVARLSGLLRVLPPPGGDEAPRQRTAPAAEDEDGDEAPATTHFTARTTTAGHDPGRPAPSPQGEPATTNLPASGPQRRAAPASGPTAIPRLPGSPADESTTHFPAQAPQRAPGNRPPARGPLPTTGPQPVPGPAAPARPRSVPNRPPLRSVPPPGQSGPRPVPPPRQGGDPDFPA